MPSEVHVRSEHAEGAYASRVLRESGRRFLEALGVGGELSVMVVNDRRIRALNREWREIDKATDVLSFEQDPSIGVLGDVVISLDTARRQARGDGRPLSQELSRLLAHGVLHLLGHDHQKPAQARRMAQAEIDLLGAVGLVGQAMGHPAHLEFTRARNAGKASSPRRSSRRTSEKTS